MIIILMQKFWSVNSTLAQERHVYACAEGSVPKCSLGQSFIQNHQGVMELSKKNLQEEGGVHPSKKISRRVNKTLDACCALRVFKHFKFLFMRLWMLGAHHLYLI